MSGLDTFSGSALRRILLACWLGIFSLGADPSEDLLLLQTCAGRGSKTLRSGAVIHNYDRGGYRSELLPDAKPSPLALAESAAGMERFDWVVVLDSSASFHERNRICDSSFQCFGIVDLTRWRGPSLVHVRASEAELDGMLEGRAAALKYVEAAGVLREVPDFPNVPLPPDEAPEGNASEAVPWGLDRLDDAAGELDGTFDAAPSGGSGAHAYILDTGIRTSHEDFGGRASPTLEVLGHGQRVCRWYDRGCAEDESGHGTHVAGVVGGSKHGVAKGVKLYAVKVLGGSGEGEIFWMLQAMEWILWKAKRPAVVHLSISSQGRLRFVKEAVDVVVRSGLPVVVAAGDSDESSCTVTPAFAPSAITVTAATRHNRRARVALESRTLWATNYGACVDLFAPGLGIESTSHISDTGTVQLSGSSVAAAHVTGAVALILAEKPRLGPEGVREALHANAVGDVLQDAPANTPNLLLRVPIEYRMTANAQLTGVPHGQRCSGEETFVAWAANPWLCRIACLNDDRCKYASFRFPLATARSGPVCNTYQHCGASLGTRYMTWMKAPEHELRYDRVPVNIRPDFSPPESPLDWEEDEDY